MKKYEIKDFLSFASAFDYSDDLGIVENEKLHKEMKNWNLKKFQEFYGFTHRDNKTGEDITKKGTGEYENKKKKRQHKK